MCEFVSMRHTDNNIYVQSEPFKGPSQKALQLARNSLAGQAWPGFRYNPKQWSSFSL